MSNQLNLVITKCSECPYYEPETGHTWAWCKKAIREAGINIPEWCPLEDKHD